MTDLANILARAGVVQRGTFMLTSGGTADFYIDLKGAYGKPEVFSSLVRALAAAVPKTATAIAASGHGGIPLATAVALRLQLPLTLVRSDPRGHGMEKMMDGHLPGSRDRVVLVDDVYTTGGSLSAMEAVLRPTGARVTARLVVVNRSGTRPAGVRALVDVEHLLR